MHAGEYVGRTSRCIGSDHRHLPQAGPKRAIANAGAVTLIQRFGSAAHLNIHLHCLVLDGVYRRTGGVPVFQEVRAPSRDELAGLLDRCIARLLKLLTRQGYLVEEEGVTYLADRDADNPLASLQAAARRQEGAEPARRARPGQESQGGPVRRCAQLQPACRGALVSRLRLHLIRFHGVLAPNAGLVR
jgi:hypothetical protein